MLRRTQKILEIYIEPDESFDNEGPADYESTTRKVTISDIFHPEWSTGALRRVRAVKRVVTVGEYVDSDLQVSIIKVLYDATQVTDEETLHRLARSVHDAVYASGGHSSHL
jgi:hypothetical protein